MVELPLELVSQGDTAAQPRTDEEIGAEVSSILREIVYALPLQAYDRGWRASRFKKTYEKLSRMHQDLFAKDQLLTDDEKEDDIQLRWDPTDVVSYGRLFGFKDWIQKYIKIPYNRQWRVQLHHLRRVRLVLEDLGFDFGDTVQHLEKESRHLWPVFLRRVRDVIALPRTEALSPDEDGAPHVVLRPFVTDDIATKLVTERLSEKLAAIRTTQDLFDLLVRAPHRYEWSITFRHSFALQSQDKKFELGSLFYKLIGRLLRDTDPKATHVLIIAAGTLTYVASEIDRLPEVRIWGDWLESIIKDLPAAMVLIAEPLAYIACIQGWTGSFHENVDRFVFDKPYRRFDFEERLRYCGGATKPDRGVLDVAYNVSDHFHNRRRYSQILSHDVGRVIEACPTLLRNPAHADLAQFITDETMKALADVGVGHALLGRAHDLMVGAS